MSLVELLGFPQCTTPRNRLNPIEIIGIDCATTLYGLRFANSETERFEARESKKNRMREVVAAKINRYEPKLRPFFIEPKLEPKLSR